jgi:hypothetical protein
MADNVPVTSGAGNTIAADEVVDGVLGTVKVQYTKLMDATIDSTNKLIVTASGAAKVDGSGATQPISGTVTANAGTNLNTSALALDATLTGGTQQTKIVQGGNTAVVDATGDLQVDVNNFPATQNVAVTSALPAGTNVIGHVIADTGSTTAVTGNVTVVQPTGTNLHTVVDSGTITLSGTSPVSGTVNANQGTANTAANKWPIEIVDSAGVNIAAVTAANAVKVDGSAVTQPVSGTVTANAGTGSFTVAQATAANLNATVTGTVTTAPPSNASTNLTQVAGATLGAITTYGTSPGAVNVPSVNAFVTNPVIVASSQLVQSATAATGVGVTVTLPAVASQFHYISFIEIVKYFTVANAASATPLVITTTNLPGSLAFSFGQPLGTIGTTDTRIYNPNSPLHSSVVNTATTIVAPATTGIIWRINVFYFAAP